MTFEHAIAIAFALVIAGGLCGFWWLRRHPDEVRGDPGVTVIDRTGPVPVARGLTDEEMRQILAAKTPTEHDYNLEDLDDDGNLKPRAQGAE